MTHEFKIIRLRANSGILATKPCAVAIGNFDGLHHGHRSVIGAMRAHAEQAGLVPSVLSFFPHPRYYFNKTAAPFLLMRLRDRLAELRNLGVKRVYLAHFDSALATMSAPDFCQHMLFGACGAKAVFVGENFAFGAARSGNIATLQSLGDAHGVSVHAHQAVMQEQHVCSSTHIRHAVEMGDMARVTSALGRPYTARARVMHGDQRGRTIGFPTANLPLLEGFLYPPNGVYVVRACVGDGSWHHGVANIGIRPSFGGDSRPRLEVHLLNYAGDLYGQTLRVELRIMLRPEVTFASVQELRAQIENDVLAAEHFIKEHAHEH